MGYYQAGDYYAAGDPAFQRLGEETTAIVRAGGHALMRGAKFMPGVGLAVGGLQALRHLERRAERTKIGKKILKVRRRFTRIGEVGVRRHRRMNVCNPRALRRSLRRVKGFEHFARQVVRIVTPKKRVSGFRFRRRRKRT